VGLGIGLAFWRGIDLVTLWHNEMPKASPPAKYMLLSGVIMGLGSPIVHKVITTIEKKRKKQSEGGTKP
jgi:hypothetical protein